MTKDQIDWLKSLDKHGLDGTIQSVLMRKDIKETSFESVLKFLIQALLNEKLFLIKNNIDLSRRVNEQQP